MSARNKVIQTVQLGGAGADGGDVRVVLRVDGDDDICTSVVSGCLQQGDFDKIRDAAEGAVYALHQQEEEEDDERAKRLASLSSEEIRAEMKRIVRERTELFLEGIDERTDAWLQGALHAVLRDELRIERESFSDPPTWKLTSRSGRTPSIIEDMIRGKVDRMIPAIVDVLDEIQLDLANSEKFAEMVRKETQKLLDVAVQEAASTAARQRAREEVAKLFPELGEEDLDKIIDQAARRRRW